MNSKNRPPDNPGSNILRFPGTKNTPTSAPKEDFDEARFDEGTTSLESLEDIMNASNTRIGKLKVYLRDERQNTLGITSDMNNEEAGKKIKSWLGKISSNEDETLEDEKEEFHNFLSICKITTQTVDSQTVDSQREDIRTDVEIVLISRGETVDLNAAKIKVSPKVSKILRVSDKMLGQKGRTILSLYLFNLGIIEGDSDEQVGIKIKEYFKKHSKDVGNTVYEVCLDLLSDNLN